jgi:hypothetical protein
MDKEITTEDMMMKMLSSRPSSCVTSWQTYDINGYTYYTKENDRKSVAQNSDIHIKAIDPQGLKTTYYGTYMIYGNSIMPQEYKYPSSGVDG